MLQQYFAAKAEHPGVLLAMRVGDFYEFYGDDAVTASRELEITLTGREDGGNGRLPMAGVPFHSVEKYLARLLAKGLKVALCDQLEDPKQAKGLVRRGVTRVLTPGTLVEDSMLGGSDNNFLAAICVQDDRVGFAVLDPSTGEFAATEIVGDARGDAIVQELSRLKPAELLVGPAAEALGEVAGQSLGASVTEVGTPTLERAIRKLSQQLRVANLGGFGCEDKPSAVVAASMILAYAEKNQLPLAHVETISTYSVDGFMRLDPGTRRSLELTQNLADGSKRFTLLSVLDQTVSAMGSRLLRRWIDQPLLDAETIRSRQNAVERFLKNALVRGDVRESLHRLGDIERLASRCAAGLAGPRDLAALLASLRTLPALEEPLRKVGLERIQELRAQISDHSEIAALLERAIVSDPPPTLRDGGVIREGFDPELDKLRDLSKNGKQYIAGLEAAERQRTGITGLKVGFNSVFGYYLEISKAHSDKAPADYVRKQTTANAERYITAELKDHESLVLGAEEKAVGLESELFVQIRSRVAEQTRALLGTARALAELDALAALSEVASLRAYCKPEIVAEDVLEIESGRHAVVEATVGGFVPNDTCVGAPGPSDSGRVMILTGPNMAGKSTYLRQTALIALMAQIGSFVPAKKCVLGLCDRIFARIGAKDELALGQSTFMVEMVESANILNHATSRSLVILDEVGRGTSTYDGLAIAWAMIERLAEISAKTMFATHYHQLNSLAEQVPGVSNFRVAVEEVGDDIVWTHRVLPGGTDRSYGIHVARMAGVPGSVLRRAQEVLGELEDRVKAPTAVRGAQKIQLTLFEAEDPEIIKELRSLDIDRITPMDALKFLEVWKQKHTT